MKEVCNCQLIENLEAPLLVVEMIKCLMFLHSNHEDHYNKIVVDNSNSEYGETIVERMEEVCNGI